MANTKRSGAKKETLPKGISRLPSGSYRVQISRKDHDPIRKTFELIGRDTKENRDKVIDEAEIWANQARLSLKNGTFTVAGPVGTVTVGDALEEYLHEVIAKKKSSGARKNDTNRIISMQEELWAKKKLLEFKQADVVKFREALKQRGWDRSFKQAQTRLKKTLEAAPPANRKEIQSRISELEKLPKLKKDLKSLSGNQKRNAHLSLIEMIEERERVTEAAPTTVTNKINLLSSALKFAGEGLEGFKNPVPGTSMPKARPGRDRRLVKSDNINEEELLLAAARESSLPHLEPLIRMAIFTALRLGRLLSLKWEYIRTVTVDGVAHQLIDIPKSIQHQNKKAGTIPVFPEIEDLLSQLKELSPTEDLFPISTDQVEHHFRVAREKAGLENFKFHDLRHEATSRLFERGFSNICLFLQRAQAVSLPQTSMTASITTFSRLAVSSGGIMALIFSTSSTSFTTSPIANGLMGKIIAASPDQLNLSIQCIYGIIG